jgi:hypothetical protein
MNEPLANGNRRILQVKPANLRHNHLYIREHLDFFPADCIGPARPPAVAKRTRREVAWAGGTR